mgnify:FL=1|tara:strand:- start:53 stop:244 length:192 start_codon:yes stop_codon:yes gene_type:complete
MKSLLEQAQELVSQGLGEIQRIYAGGYQFETWFIYTGRTPIHLGDQLLEEGDMLELTFWSYDE